MSSHPKRLASSLHTDAKLRATSYQPTPWHGLEALDASSQCGSARRINLDRPSRCGLSMTRSPGGGRCHKHKSSYNEAAETLPRAQVDKVTNRVEGYFYSTACHGWAYPHFGGVLVENEAQSLDARRSTPPAQPPPETGWSKCLVRCGATTCAKSVPRGKPSNPYLDPSRSPGLRGRSARQAEARARPV